MSPIPLLACADTHCNFEALLTLLAREQANAPAAVLHCGDIGLIDRDQLPPEELALALKHGDPLDQPKRFIAGEYHLHLPTYCVPGNHDDCLRLVPMFLAGEIAVPNFHLLKQGEVRELSVGRRTLKIMGFGKIGGEPAVRTPEKSALYYTAEELAAAMKNGAGQNIDVLILHEPPEITVCLGGVSQTVGSRELIRLVEAVRPRLTLCGHLHQEYVAELSGVPVIGLGYGAMGVSRMVYI